jgi:DNA-directed RNA polymerase
VWPNGVLTSLGRFLYGIIMRDVKIDVNIMKPNAKTKYADCSVFQTIP